MKHLLKSTFLILATFLLVACGQEVERAERTLTIVQDTVTAIVNELTEIQLAENNIQADFEATLSSNTEDFSSFLADDSKILQNVAYRRDHLDTLESHQQELANIAEEFTTQIGKSPLNEADMKAVNEKLTSLSEDLTTYITDYRNNLDTETTIFKALGNPDTDYDSFSTVFQRVDILYTTNHINLEKMLGYFESINTQLVNFKVYLANLKESN